MRLVGNQIAVLDESEDNLLSKYVEKAGRLDYCVQIPAHYTPHIRPGMVVVDAGASIGDHTVAYARLAGAENIHAFECAPAMVECLRHNCPDCHIYPVALSDREATVYFHQNRENAGGSYCDTNPEDALPVRCAAMDSFNISNVGFIKWDLEGYEIKAIRGATDIIAQGRPVMMIEVIEPQLARAGGSVEELFSLLESLNYSWQPVIGNINTIGEYFELCCRPR